MRQHLEQPNGLQINANDYEQIIHERAQLFYGNWFLLVCLKFLLFHWRVWNFHATIYTDSLLIFTFLIFIDIIIAYTLYSFFFSFLTRFLFIYLFVTSHD